MQSTQLLVISDLDGSLLDHHTYDYSPASPALERLRDDQVPVVFCTSKTRAEVLHLREQLNNRSSFIVENGAAVYLPKNEFSDAPPDCEDAGDYWRRSFSRPRDHWLRLLDSIRPKFGHCFDHFAAMTAEQVQDVTGLSLEEAARAKAREFGEPLLWRGSDEELVALNQWFTEKGALLLTGGRFVHVADDADKGQAMDWLKSVYQSRLSSQVSVKTLALGDSQNDAAMLDAADYAVVIRSPVHGFPKLQRRSNVCHTENCGPGGWAEGVSHWLSVLNKNSSSIKTSL